MDKPRTRSRYSSCTFFRGHPPSAEKHSTATRTAAIHGKYPNCDFPGNTFSSEQITLRRLADDLPNRTHRRDIGSNHLIFKKFIG
jgi:hypothetical protein